MDRLDSDMVPKAELDKAIQRAEKAESRICNEAVEKAAAKLGCTHPHVMVNVLAGKVKLIDGEPKHVLTTTDADGESVEVYESVEDAVKPHAENPVNALLFGRDASRAYASDANGRIDVRNLNGNDYSTLRKTSEGRRALGLE